MDFLAWVANVIKNLDDQPLPDTTTMVEQYVEEVWAGDWRPLEADSAYSKFYLRMRDAYAFQLRKLVPELSDWEISWWAN
jgi:hypothetical protein